MKRKRILSMLFAATMCVGLMAGYGTSAAAGEANAERPLEGEHLVMAVNAEYAPFESVNEDGEIVGFDIELNELLAEKLGYTFEYSDMDFTGLIPSLQSGRADYCISALSANEEREKVVDFSEGYYTPVTAILVPAGSDIQSVDDLKGKKIGVNLGTEFEAFAKTIEDAEVISFESMPSTVQLIGTDELDCEIMDSDNAFSYTEASNGTLDYRIVKNSDTVDYFHPYCIVFPKGSEYVEIFNNALDELVEDGTMEDLQAKWFGEAYTDALREAE